MREEGGGRSESSRGGITTESLDLRGGRSHWPRVPELQHERMGRGGCCRSSDERCRGCRVCKKEEEESLPGGGGVFFYYSTHRHADPKVGAIARVCHCYGVRPILVESLCMNWTSAWLAAAFSFAAAGTGKGRVKRRGT